MALAEDEEPDPPLVPCFGETARVDMGNFGRSRAEIRHIMVHRIKGLRSKFDGATGQPCSEPVWEALIALAVEWHMRSDGPVEQTLLDLKRKVRNMINLWGQNKEEARAMALSIIEE
eukprot:6810190-Alexandrium_andersonii.AAC.1